MSFADTAVIFAAALLLAQPLSNASEPPEGGNRRSEDQAKYLDAEEVIVIQDERDAGMDGRYDWGPSIMLDDDGIYKMWWTRLGGGRDKEFTLTIPLPDGSPFEYKYPDWGDRTYYAESRDGVHWNIEGADFTGNAAGYSPDSPGPLLVMVPLQKAPEYYHIGCPSVVKVDGVYRMFYEAPSEFQVQLNDSGGVRYVTEYQNQVLLATSRNGKNWSKFPTSRAPKPIIPAPEGNTRPGKQRYGLGQPSACYKDGRFILHYVDACTGPGDFQVRVESDEPSFSEPRVFSKRIGRPRGGEGIPAGAVARFAQTDVKYLGDVWYLVRPAYGTGNLGIMASRTGLFPADANAPHPKDVFPQLRIKDPLGQEWTERLFPRFLTNPEGEILVQDGMVSLYYSAGTGWKEKAYSWDLRLCRVRLEDLEALMDGGK